MKKEAITLTTLAARLERAIHADVGMKGLNTLLYGWARKKNWNTNIIFTINKFYIICNKSFCK